jgi:hypothetical protein
MRRLLTTTAALLALAAPLLAAAPSDAAPADVEIKPGKLSRGPDIAGAHLEGKTVVDGDVRVKLQAPRVLLYGKWNDFYIVATGDREWGNVKLLRVSATGVTKRLARFIDPFNTELDSDGGQVAYSLGDSTQKPQIEVYDLQLNQPVALNAFASLPTLLEFDEGLVVASFFSFKVKTITWDTVADVTLKVNSKVSNYASKAHDLLGFFSKDPFNGGCQVLTHLSDPTDVLWTNCDERIEAVSPDGKRVATIALLSDGIGPADVMVRKIGGAPVAHYSINGWFGRIWWETPTKLLMESNGKTQSATVRCKVEVCNRATDLAPTPNL